MITVGGVQRPKNENFSNIVDQEREAIQMRQEPCDSGMSKKERVILGILVPISVCVLLLTLLLSK